jgi:hypothetical protein
MEVKLLLWFLGIILRFRFLFLILYFINTVNYFINTVKIYVSTFVFSFYKILFMNKLEFSSVTNCSVWISEPIGVVWFSVRICSFLFVVSMG